MEKTKEIWNAAITVAINTCVGISDEYNNDDFTQEAHGANKCANEVGKLLGHCNEFIKQIPKDERQKEESGEQDELKKENTRLRVIQQEVYVKTDNPWQSDLDATAYDGKQYHFDKHTGYFHTKEQLVELLRGAYRAGRNFEYAEHYGGVPNQYPIETTYIDQIINP